MTNQTLPNTSLNISSICLGTGELGTTLTGEEAFHFLDTYAELGGNFIDTAHNYGDWVPTAPRSASEKTLGEWMKKRGNRGQIVLATKGAHWQLDKPEVPRLRRQDIESDLNSSLTHLQTDHIDLYWLHRDDPNTTVEVILDTLNDQVKLGKIRYFGASNWKPERLRAAKKYADAKEIRGFVADQVLWNAAVLAKPPYGDPTVGWMDTERFAFHQETGMALLAFQSQAYGLFQRMHTGTLDAMNPGFRGFYNLEESQKRYASVTQVMAETGLTVTQVTLGYLLSQPFVTIPIVGCRSEAQLRDSMTAGEVRLTPKQLRRITESAAKSPYTA